MGPAASRKGAEKKKKGGHVAALKVDTPRGRNLWSGPASVPETPPSRVAVKIFVVDKI
jgi:hypothetical protein